MQTESTHTADAAASRAFARFAASGEADALAEVFDRTAPQLAVLAGHLVPGDAHAVEDLVQTTFLEAIRCAQAFTPGRRVLPWLVRILARRAANLRRQRGRRRERGDDELLALADASFDPARLAEDTELAAQVATAIEALDAPYREALALRLVHGLSPVEIARALDRPLGTVHAQLHRGGERLRRALPRLAVLCIDLATPQLAAVRARVLAAARDFTVATPATLGLFALGGLLMTKKMLAIAALLALALTGAYAWLAPEAWSVSPPIDPSPTELVSTAIAQPPKPEETREREALPTVDARVTGAQVTLRGRVIAEESGAPLAGCTIAAMRIEPVKDPPLDATPEATVTTDAEGRYELRVRRALTDLTRVLVRCAGRVPMCAVLEELRPDATIDSGDIPMPRGAELRLRVRDEHGEPVESFAIQLREVQSPRSTDDRFSAVGWGGTRRTNADGIAGPHSVAVGLADIDFAGGTGHVFSGSTRLVIPEDRTEPVIDLSVRSPDPARSIAGVVVDEQGTPLVGVDVVVKAPRGGAYARKSFNGGRFQIDGFAPESKPTNFVRIGRGSGYVALDYELLAPREPVAVGTRDVRVVARRLPATDLTLRVVRAADREPIERFRCTAMPVTQSAGETTLGGFFGIPTSLRLDGARRHGDGLALLPELPAVDHLLVVAPDDPELAPLVLHELRPQDHGDAPLEIAVPAAIRWRVRVTDARGNPCAGTRVSLVRGMGRTRVTENLSTLSWNDVFERGRWTTPLAVEIGGGTTDGDGIVTLRSQANVDGCALRVHGRLHRDLFQSLQGEVAPDEVRTLVVSPGARITGHLEPPELVAALGPTAQERTTAAMLVDPESSLTDMRIRVFLQSLGAEKDATAQVGDDGRFAFDGVAPGDYAVLVQPVHGGTTTRVAEVHGLRAGEVRELALDLRPCEPAHVTGLALLGGVPVTRMADLSLGSSRMKLGRDGRFEGAVSPGEHRWMLSVRESLENVSEFDLEEPLVVTPGAQLDVTVDFPHRRVDLHVTDCAGARRWTAIALHRVDASGGPGEVVHGYPLAADGRISVHATWREPLFAMLLLEKADNDPPEPRTIALGRVEVPSGEASAAYEFTVDTSAVPR